MKKKVLLLALIMCLSILSIAISVSADTTVIKNGTCGKGLTWTLDNVGTLTISGEGPMWNLGDGSAFGWYDYYVETIVIEEGVTHIGRNAFRLEADLTSIAIPSTVTSIGEGAFLGCHNLWSIEIPDGVKSIEKETFHTCGLKRIILPESIERIEEDAFFLGCDSGNEVYIPNLESWCNIDFVNSYSNPLKGGKLYVDGILVENLTIPKKVTTIKDYAFQGCYSLYKVTISDGVTSIGKHAFDGCLHMKQVEISDSVTAIGEYAFKYSCALTKMVIPNSVTAIGDYTFERCDNLAEIKIPKTVASIGKYAFADCKRLKRIYYSGSELDWNKIIISDYGNDYLKNSKIIYSLPTVIIQYSSNGGADFSETQITDVNSTIILTALIPQRDNYKFLGWSKSAESTKPEYVAGDTIDVTTENITLYAVWQRIVVTNTSVINNIIMVTPTNSQIGDCIIVACYKEEQMVYVDVYSYNGETTVPFIPDEEYDTIKIMVWESLDNLKPLSSIEII